MLIWRSVPLEWMRFTTLDTSYLLRGWKLNLIRLKSSQSPIPRNLKQLRRFLGLIGYYRRFIQDYGKICRPLTFPLRKKSFKWSEEATKSIWVAQTQNDHHPVLTLLGFNKPFLIETDASRKDMEVMLMQKGHSIAFISKAFSEKKHTVISLWRGIIGYYLYHKKGSTISCYYHLW